MDNGDRDACGATEKWCGSLSSRSRWVLLALAGGLGQ